MTRSTCANVFVWLNEECCSFCHAVKITQHHSMYFVHLSLSKGRPPANRAIGEPDVLKFRHKQRVQVVFRGSTMSHLYILLHPKLKTDLLAALMQALQTTTGLRISVCDDS